MKKIRFSKQSIMQIFILMLLLDYALGGFLAMNPLSVGGVSVLETLVNIILLGSFLGIVWLNYTNFSIKEIAVIVFFTMSVLWTIIFYPENTMLYHSLIINIIKGVAIFYASSKISDYDVLDKALSKASVIIFVVLCVWPIYNQTITFSTTNYMVFSNGMLIAVIFFLQKALQGRKKYWILFGIGFLEILLWGSRSPLLSIVLYIYVHFLVINNTPSKARLYRIFFLTFLLTAMIIALSNKAFCLYLYNFVIGISGKNSRFLYEILYGTSILDGHGRGEILSYIFKNYLNILFVGKGLGGDRVFLSGINKNYAHNIFLEIIIEYGFIVGIFLIIWLLRSLCSPLKKKMLTDSKWSYAVILTTLSGKLFFSGTWTNETLFYLLLGLSIAYCNINLINTSAGEKG